VILQGKARKYELVRYIYKQDAIIWAVTAAIVISFSVVMKLSFIIPETLNC
jgi:hypothetical protein